MKKIFLLLISLTAFATSAEIAIIANPLVTDSLSQKQISRIFLRKDKKYPSGSAVVPFNQVEGSDIRVNFEKIVLKKSSAQINGYWGKYVFTGKGKPPVVLNSASAVIAKVKSDPAAIGYIELADVTAEVKVIAKF